MEEQIKLLVKLQEVDKQIFELRKEKETKPIQIEQLRAEYENEQGRLKELNDRSKSLQVKRKEKEIDLESKEIDIKKYQTQIYQVKTNKEYSSLDSEIKGLKADCSVLEDEILKIMEDLEEVDSQIKVEKERLAAAEAELKQKEEVVKRAVIELEEKLSSLTQKRQEITPAIKPELLPMYENVQGKKNDGLALVKVMNNVCQGCHINIPSQRINEIMMKEKIYNCESCARLLYYE